MFILPSLFLFVLVTVGTVSGRVGDVGRDLELSQIHHRKLYRATEGAAIEGRFIVVLSDRVENVLQMALNLLTGSDAQLEYEYDSVVKGFTVSKLIADFLVAILDEDLVEYVEEDQVIIEESAAVSVKNPASWGLDRVDGSLDSKYDYSYTGKGVEVFVLDSGVNFKHVDFKGRASCGYSAIYGEDCTDVRGHGSHVSGAAVGTTYGVAKNASLISIKVLSAKGTGSVSGVLAGINFINNRKKSKPSQPMVANMSLGGGASATINKAVTSAISTGVVFVVSAGNDGSTACDKSPASVGPAITIGAIDNTDTRATYSNYGSCVDIFGPGSNIVSAWWSSTTATKYLSGTSMATPFATGVAALYLEKNPAMTPAQVKAAMLADGILGVVKNRGTNSPNILLSTRNLNSSVTTSALTPVTPPPPTTTITTATVPVPVPMPVASPMISPVASPTKQCGRFLAGCKSTSAGNQCCSGICWFYGTGLSFCSS